MLQNMRLIWMKVQAHGTNPDLYRCYLLSKSDWKRIKYTDKNEPLQTWQPIEFNTCMRTSRFTMYAFFHNWYLQPCCSLIKCRNGDYKSHLTLVYVKFGRNFHFFNLHPYGSSGPSIWRPGSSSTMPGSQAASCENLTVSALWGRCSGVF